MVTLLLAGTVADIPGKFRILGVQHEVMAEVPPFMAQEAFTVALSFNMGEDFSPVPDSFRSYEPLNSVSIRPNCGPVTGGTTVTVAANGIFETEKPYLRLQVATM